MNIDGSMRSQFATASKRNIRKWKASPGACYCHRDCGWPTVTSRELAPLLRQNGDSKRSKRDLAYLLLADQLVHGLWQADIMRGLGQIQ